MLTQRQKELITDALTRCAVEARREAESLERFVVEETPQRVRDYIDEQRALAAEYEAIKGIGENTAVHEAMAEVVNHNWDDEREDLRDQIKDGMNEGGEGHIFSALVTLANWLDGTDKTPTDHLND